MGKKVRFAQHPEVALDMILEEDEPVEAPVLEPVSIDDSDCEDDCPSITIYLLVIAAVTATLLVWFFLYFIYIRVKRKSVVYELIMIPLHY